MRHRAARELFDYWNALRGSRPAPERAEIDLAAIRGLIADMFMLEVDAADLFPFVLSGTRVNALACTEQHGRSFLDLWARQEQRNVAALLLAVIDSACPLIAVADRPDRNNLLGERPARGRYYPATRPDAQLTYDRGLRKISPTPRN